MVDNFEEMSLTPEEVRKHPLENAWTLWFFKVILMLVTLDEQCMVSLNYSFFQNDKSRTWEENQRPIITVTTVEDFWSLYNHIETPSKLPFGSDYSLFKVLVPPDTNILQPYSLRKGSFQTGRTHGMPLVEGGWWGWIGENLILLTL